MTDFVTLQADPVAFRAALLIETDAGPRRLDSVLDDWQRDDFTALDPGWRAVAGHTIASPSLRGWLERPRGHSKTSDLAAMVSWVLFASRRAVRGVAAAADRDQARLLRDAIESLVRSNPWLAAILDVQAHRVVNRHTGSDLTILSSDAATSYGLTPDFIVIDELTHWQSRDLWDSLISAAAKRATCLVCVITNAGFGDSWQWDIREAVRSDPDWHFGHIDGPRASWISAKHLGEQRRLLPSIAFDRLWLNRWTSGSGDAFTEVDLSDAIVLGGATRVAERGWLYVAGLDLGITRDASALVVVGKHVGYSEEIERPKPARSRTSETLIDVGAIESALTEEKEFVYHPGSGKLRLCHIHLALPGGTGGRVSIDEIETAIIGLNAMLPLSCVACDPWNAALLVERLNKQGVPAEPVDFTGGNLKSMAMATLDAFTNREIELYDDATLLADLRNLRVVERSYGFRLESPRTNSGNGTRHGDTATALSLALHIARRFTNETRKQYTGELLCWP